MRKNSTKLPIMLLAIMLTLVLYTGCWSWLPDVGQSMTPAPAARQYTVTFKNVTGETIFYLYISPRSNDNWGNDWLGSDVLSNNNTFTARLSTGQYDVKATDLSGNTTYVFLINVDRDGTYNIEPGDRRSSAPAARQSTAPAPTARQYTVTFRNATGETIFYLYISPRSNDNWGDDWLGSNVLSNNNTFTVRLSPGQYDVKATDLSGNTKYVFWIRVDSDNSQFTINPGDRQR